jgi:putative membrane protein
MGAEGFDPTPEAERRTLLASERTMLAWLRTGLTVIAVALAVGRIIPEVGGTKTAWPYAVIGVAYSVLGIAMVGYGLYRAKRIDDAVRAGTWAEMDGNFMRVMAAGTILLALATAALIIAGT